MLCILVRTTAPGYLGMRSKLQKYDLVSLPIESPIITCRLSFESVIEFIHIYVHCRSDPPIKPGHSALEIADSQLSRGPGWLPDLRTFALYLPAALLCHLDQPLVLHVHHGHIVQVCYPILNPPNPNTIVEHSHWSRALYRIEIFSWFCYTSSPMP